jgi:hypothetical protein
MMQATLFPTKESGRSRKRDPQTAKDAAKLADVKGLEFIVISWLSARPAGLTTHELSELAGTELVSISPRIKPLVEKNLVRDSGQRRPGPSGRKSIVWELV